MTKRIGDREYFFLDICKKLTSYEASAAMTGYITLTPGTDCWE